MNSHPHFNDRGTLDWHTHFADALAAARPDGKLVFIEMGRQACGNCRTLVESIVPQPKIAALLRDRFVALASDADDPEPPIIDLGMQNLPDAMMLSFVMITDSEGNFLAGSHGAVRPDHFLETLQGLAAKG